MTTVHCEPDPVITIGLSHPVTPLSIGQECVAAGYWWNALTLPGFAMRYEYAPPSQFLPGQQLLSAVPDAAAVAVAVVAAGLTLQDVETRKAQLAAYLAQWRYVVSITADGVSLGAYAAKPTIPVWGDVTPQDLGMLAAVATVSIPVNPPGSP